MQLLIWKNFVILKTKELKNIQKEIFLSIGRLTKQKNFKYLIEEITEFFQHNKSFDLYIIGEGEQKRITKFNIKKIIR